MLTEVVDCNFFQTKNDNNQCSISSEFTMNFVLQIHSFIFNDVVLMSSITHLTRYLCQSWATTPNQEITSPYQIPTIHQKAKLQKMFCNLKFHHFAKFSKRLYTYGPPSKFQIRLKQNAAIIVRGDLLSDGARPPLRFHTLASSYKPVLHVQTMPDAVFIQHIFVF